MGTVKDGFLMVTAEEVMHCRDHFKFQLAFSNLPSVGWLNPDPKVYAEIRRASERGTFELGKLFFSEFSIKILLKL